ncbi:MAG: PD-(D/E)XK nuclease family protein [Bacteroidales bacterium]|nr:PD-(D/E)XK nuclease family protein [Bacteroidales bacterium]
MTSFLSKIAQHLFDTCGTDLSEVCLVMPNRRAGLFFRKYLSAHLKHPAWSPVIYSIEDFMAILSELNEADPMNLLLDLFELHRKKDKEKAQSFEEFLTWGPQLLADFNEIDRYLADPEYLFGYLSEARAINLWNLDKSPLTEFQLNYLRFYHSLYDYYQQLTVNLMGRGEAYQGLSFRKAAENLEAGIARVPWKHIVFAGFNALTAAEEKVMLFLQKSGKAEFLWDADHYYFDKGDHEAGSFLRKWLSSWPLKQKNWIGDDFLTEGKNIEVIGVPNVTGQVKLCAEILRQNGKELDEHTAIILPDEKLLLPLLNSLPEEVSELNVTMGLPLRHTPLADLLDLVFQMHLHALQMKNGSTGGNQFYFRDVVRILQHPMVRRMAVARMQGNQFAVNELIVKAQSGHRVFLSHDDLEGAGLFDAGLDFLHPFIEPWNVPADAIRDLQKIVALSSQTNPVESEYAFAFARILHQLNELIQERPGIFTWPTFYQFFRQMLERTSLPFYGEPVSGIQIMGMLETRTLDFDQVILLSCNEGMLPAGRLAPSFIPFDIKKEFGLPSYQHKDAVYAYHFYRLLQRAKKVWLLYVTVTDQLGSGEKSRYLQQITRELPVYNPAISIRERFLHTPMPPASFCPAITIPKEDAILHQLKEKAAAGFAPTVLNAFRKCSLQFYFSAVAGLREPEEMEETINPKALGNAVHQALYELFLPYKNTPLTAGHIKKMADLAGVTVKKAFADKFSGSSLHFGKNLLLVKVAENMVINYLHTQIIRFDEAQNRVNVALLEQPLWKVLSVPFKDSELEVRIKGFIDRMDRVGNEVHVIDYKTGSVLKKELTVELWEDLLHAPHLDKTFQLLTYGWLLYNPAEKTIIHTGIVSLKKPGAGFLSVKVPEGKDTYAEFATILRDLLSEIFNPDLPFSQTEDLTICSNCPYLNICQR